MSDQTDSVATDETAPSNVVPFPSAPDAITPTVIEQAAALLEEAGHGDRVIQPEDTPSESGPAPAVPRDVPLPFPFDAEAALRAVEAKDRDVQDLADEYERLKKEAASAKRDWESGVAELHRLIVGFRDERQGLERRAQEPLLSFEGIAPAASMVEAAKPGCAFERQTGKPCPICRVARPTGDNANVVETEAHVEQATTADRLERWQRDLHAVDVYIDDDDLWGLVDTDDECQMVVAWASAAKVTGIAPSDILGMVPCQAGECGSTVQACRRCGRVLRQASDVPYPVGAYVGVSCPGGDVEGARPVAKRGTKKRRTRSTPEDVAKEQAQAPEAQADPDQVGADIL